MSPTTLYDRVWARYGRGESEDFIRRLKSTMKTHNIRPADLARRSGFQPPHISRWLSTNPETRVNPQLETKLILDEAVDALIEEARP